MITSQDIAWTAGFIEGEGWIGLNYKSPTISICQVQKWPLDKVVKLFRGRIHVTKRLPLRQDIHYWTLSGAYAAALIMTIFKFLSPKRQEQARNALLFWKTSGARQQKVGLCKRGHNTSDPAIGYIWKNKKTSCVHVQCRECHKPYYRKPLRKVA